MSTEQAIVKAMLGGEAPSVLMTDAYKFSMAQAGMPLREETFYLSARRGGPHFIPFNLKECIGLLTPDLYSLDPVEENFLNKYGYGMTPSMKSALGGRLKLSAPKPGTWVLDKEPLAMVTGPSFLGSWLEPMLIWFHFPIQVATQMMGAAKNEHLYFAATCEDEREIIKCVAEKMISKWRPDLTYRVVAKRHEYALSVENNLKELVSVLRESRGKDAVDPGSAILEVGMRSVTCMQMHELALSRAKLYGVGGTSNVYLAQKMGMVPRGTTGHEHQQRWFGDDSAFMALQGMRKGPISLLFDTFNLERGIQSAIQIMKRNPTRKFTARFDSGPQSDHFGLFAEAERKDRTLHPDFCFMDSMNPEKLRERENRAKELEIALRRVFYGAGEGIVNSRALTDMTRSKVSAVYKLCAVEDLPTMKFAGVRGKMSLPGKIQALHRVPGGHVDSQHEQVEALVTQSHELIPNGFWLRDLMEPTGVKPTGPLMLSESTQMLIYRIANMFDASHFLTLPIKGVGPCQ